jgi:hypothetical protein
LCKINYIPIYKIINIPMFNSIPWNQFLLESLIEKKEIFFMI